MDREDQSGYFKDFFQGLLFKEVTKKHLENGDKVKYSFSHFFG